MNILIYLENINYMKEKKVHREDAKLGVSRIHLLKRWTLSLVSYILIAQFRLGLRQKYKKYIILKKNFNYCGKNMKKVATLGPSGTFSEMATLRYLDTQDTPFEITLFRSIKHALNEIGESCDIGILPIENFSEGFISLVLDELIELDLVIMDEIVLPIEFSFIANTPNIEDVKKLYVQFVAKGQCFEFLQTLANINVETTESNIESLHKVMGAEADVAAIVPANSFDASAFSTVVNKVNDYENNQTRFLVLTRSSNKPQQDYGDRTTIIVLDDDDRPGLLGDVLLSFSKRQINLTSIMSRPTRKAFGKYHFFIDFDGNQHEPMVADALNEIKLNNNVKILGSYKRAKLNN
ncbi:prephenate dehydratase [Glaciecola sp. 1036]|uniref:prephenate dehydratase n=1 Tax=Alteromonadaceae TaxID=72275 RepID=UPI003D0422C9